MKYKKLMLEPRHAQVVLSKDIVIGSSHSRDGKQKQFTFNPWVNEYRVYYDGNIIDAGQAIEELMDVYNDL